MKRSVKAAIIEDAILGGGGGPVYLIQDEFNVARAAGSVNGTSAEPGPGTRAVTDTGNVAQIAAGKFTITSSTGSGDPMLSYTDSFARAAGLALMSLVNINDDGVLSFDNDAGSDNTPEGGGIRQDGTNLKFMVGNVDIGTSVASTDYKFCIISRAVGAYGLIKGGAFTDWTLLWVENSITHDPVYVQFNPLDAGDDYSIDWFRVAQLGSPWTGTYGPATNAAVFTGANGTALSALTNAVGGAWTGATWDVQTNAARNSPTQGSELATGTLTVGTWYIITATEVDHFYTGCAINDTFRATATTALDANNKVKALTLSTLPASVDASENDVIVQADATLTAGTQAGVVVCLDSAASPANFLIGYHDGTNAILEKCVAGTYTTLISAAAAYSAGKTIVVIKDGTSVDLFYNNAKIGTTQTVSDAGIISNTRHGLFSTHADNRLDNFQVYPRDITGAAKTQLDLYSQ